MRISPFKIIGSLLAVLMFAPATGFAAGDGAVQLVQTSGAGGGKWTGVVELSSGNTNAGLVYSCGVGKYPIAKIYQSNGKIFISFNHSGERTTISGDISLDGEFSFYDRIFAYNHKITGTISENKLEANSYVDSCFGTINATNSGTSTAIKSGASTSKAPKSDNAVSDYQSVESKLIMIKSLLDRGLINEKEAAGKRKSILDSLK